MLILHISMLVQEKRTLAEMLLFCEVKKREEASCFLPPCFILQLHTAGGYSFIHELGLILQILLEHCNSFRPKNRTVQRDDAIQRIQRHG